MPRSLMHFICHLLSLHTTLPLIGAATFTLFATSIFSGTAVSAPQRTVVDCTVLVDQRTAEPVRAIIQEFMHRTGANIAIKYQNGTEIEQSVANHQVHADAIVCMAESRNADSPLSQIPGAQKVAWKHPGAIPVWAAPVDKKYITNGLVKFLGGPVGHRIWSVSKAGFTIVSGKTHAAAIDWVVENRVKNTYRLTATRILGEIDGIRKGICIDIGCGPGTLDIELAKRTDFTVIGLDIDAGMKPLFEKRARAAGLEKRLKFVAGDAQKMPFPDNYADVIVSRGTLTFIPDIGKCLREVERVLKPTGIAFLGGRYLFTPQEDRISNEKFKQIVRDSGVRGAQVILFQGQWVKIVGPKAPRSASGAHGGPHMLAARLVSDYGITTGDCLVVCANDGKGTQALQQGLVDNTQMHIVALYPTTKLRDEARRRLHRMKLDQRIECRIGTLDQLPFERRSFDLVTGVGPMLIFGNRQAKLRELQRVLRKGGVAMIGGRFLGMPAGRRVSNATLQADADKAGISGFRVLNDRGGQWVEIINGIPGVELRR